MANLVEETASHQSQRQEALQLNMSIRSLAQDIFCQFLSESGCRMHPGPSALRVQLLGEFKPLGVH